MSESTGKPPYGGSIGGSKPDAVRHIVLPLALGASIAPVTGVLRNDYVAGLIAAVPIVFTVTLVFFLVICPAVWSKNVRRQAAALDVLDRLLGRPDRGTRTTRSA